MRILPEDDQRLNAASLQRVDQMKDGLDGDGAP
jgi:hypothetical protein